MKKYFLLLLLCPIFLFGQKPEKVYSISVKDMPLSYHLEQSKLWKKEATKSNSPDDWLNYFIASRMSNLLTKGDNKPNDMNTIVKQISKQIPGTFEVHYIQAWNLGNQDPKGWEHIQKAHQIAPERSEIYHSFVSYYERKRDLKKRELYNQKVYDSEEYSPGMMRWNYNMLMSVQQNGILLTYGDGDTYPSWILQDALEIRKDILVLNIFMIRDKDYRNRIFAELGIPPLSSGEDLTKLPVQEFYRLLAKHLNKNAQRPVYFSVAIGKAISRLLTDSLYMEGLAFRYSDKPYDNIPVLASNFENRLLFDHFKASFSKDISETLINTININYLPALALLYKHYTKTNDHSTAEKVKGIGLTIAEKKNMEEKVKKYFTIHK